MSENLTPELLKLAYSQGFFPMPDEHGKMLWYKPDPRAIIPLENFHVSRSLRRSIRNRGYQCSINRDFPSVIEACANREETWINAEIKRVYTQLHELGYAHSVEVWHQDKLVGGLYGVHLGAAFFAESKFHHMRDASKVALCHLVEHLKKKGFLLLEVQFLTDHLATLGAKEIGLSDYLGKLAMALESTPPEFSAYS